MSAGKYNITLDQCSTFALRVILEQPSGTPVILNDYTIRAQVAYDALRITVAGWWM